jgi:hypothetical protein
MGWVGALSAVVWFLGLVFIQKTGPPLCFLFRRLIKIAAKLLPSLRKKITRYILILTDDFFNFHICLFVGTQLLFM